MGKRLLDLVRQPLALSLLAAAGLLALGQVLSPGFAAPAQVVRLLTVAAILGLVSAGQNLVILGGGEGIDMSVGAQISLGAAVAGNVMAGSDAALPGALVVALALGFGVGLLNGLGVVALRIPPLVMTLGMGGVVQGALIVLSRGVPSGNASPALSAFINHPAILGLPGVLWVWLAAGVLLWAVLRRTRFGYAVYAVGSNAEAARLAGVPVARVRALLYAGAGAAAAVTGVCVLGYTGNSFISVGDQYVLPSVIAVVVGGTSLSGGSGGYWGTMAGAVVLVLLQSVLTTLRMEAFGRQVVFGVTLLVLMLLHGRQRAMRG